METVEVHQLIINVKYSDDDKFVTLSMDDWKEIVKFVAEHAKVFHTVDGKPTPYDPTLPSTR